MSIRTEIDRIISAVSDAHEKVLSKGGTTSQPYLVGNLADAIETIPEATIVEPNLQSKTVTPTTSEQTVSPDAEYDGLSEVVVAAIPAKYPDVSNDTVTADVLLKGYTSHDKNGNPITGTYEAPAAEDLTSLLDEQETKLNTLLTTLDGKAGGSGGGASVETCTVVGPVSYYMTLGSDFLLSDLFHVYASTSEHTVIKGGYILVPVIDSSGFQTAISPSSAVEQIKTVTFKGADYTWYKVNDSIHVLIDD